MVTDYLYTGKMIGEESYDTDINPEIWLNRIKMSKFLAKIATIILQGQPHKPIILIFLFTRLTWAAWLSYVYIEHDIPSIRPNMHLTT